MSCRLRLVAVTYLRKQKNEAWQYLDFRKFLNLYLENKKEKIKMKSCYFMLFLLIVSAKRRHHHDKHRKRTHKGNYYKKVRSISKVISFQQLFCQSIFHVFPTRLFFRLAICCWWIGKLKINCQVKMLAGKVITISNQIFTGILTGMKPNVNLWFRFRNIQNRMHKWVFFVIICFLSFSNNFE